MTYLRNCWYKAGWADELGKDGLARTLLDIPVFLIRSADGTAQALLDRCPHRFAPLSSGSLEGGVVACRYHGLAFEGSGQCVRNPHGPVTAALTVSSYPVVERHRALWIWLGDPAFADPAKVPDFAFLQEVLDTALNRAYLLGAANYQLYVDNILDLSHTDFLHPDTRGGGSITRTRGEVEQRPNGSIAIHWDCNNDIPPPLVRDKLPAGIDRAYTWTHVQWQASATMKLVHGAWPSAPPAKKPLFPLTSMTPETASSTHYFYASTRNFSVDDDALNEAIGATRARIFSTEDEPMIAGQQARLGTPISGA